jgi:hypothetical protein
MNFDIKKLVIGILSVIIAVLGGNAYQTSNSLNNVQKSMNQLTQTVNTMNTSKMVANEETE